MAKFFSIFKNKGPVLITLLLLIVLGACYVFLYIPENEKKVQERHFRCLQTIDSNIHNKIDNSISLIDNLLMSTAHAELNKHSLTDKDDLNKYIDSLNNYITHYSRDDFTLQPIHPVTENTDADNLDTINSDGDLKQFTLSIKRKITVEYSNGKHTKDTRNLGMGIRYKISQFIRPLLTSGVFDHYVVFYNDEGSDKEKEKPANAIFYNNNSNKESDKEKHDFINKVIYESFPSGLSYLEKDSILQAKNGIITPGIRSLNLSGKDYKVFTQSINIDSKSEFIVAGLVSDKNYQKEKNQLPIGFVLLLITCAFGMIVSLPWVKLYNMGNKDKLTVADGISSVLVSMLLMSLLFFSIFNYGVSLNFNSNYKQSYSSGNTLAKSIISSFSKELDAAYSLLVKYNGIHDHFDNNIVNLGASHAMYNINDIDSSVKYDWVTNLKKFPKDESDNLLYKPGSNISVKEVFWLDTASGMETTNWNTKGYNAPHVKYNSRDYFTSLKKGQGNNRVGNSFYIDQVVSKTRSVFTSIIAMKPKGAKIAAMTFTAKSLEHVVMPDGFQFAIIDYSGKVRYHSQPLRNLNENLKKEFADSSDLVSCLQAGSETSFMAEYYGKEYDVTIKPFPNLPYFVVIFKNLEYTDARSFEPYVFTLSMSVFFIFTVLLQFAIVFLVSSKRSF